MTKEELEKDIYYQLRDRFKHTSNPYQDIQIFALNEFFADYIINKLSLNKPNLKDIKPIGYKCLRCGRDNFKTKQPHNCDTGFRKRNIIWQPIFE